MSGSVQGSYGDPTMSASVVNSKTSSRPLQDSMPPPKPGGFSVEEVSKMVKSCIETRLGGQGTSYSHSSVSHWTAGIVEDVLKQLSIMNDNYKYVATCVIMERNGTGLHTASSCYWDNHTDGSCSVRWENKSMYCIVSVFALAV